MSEIITHVPIDQNDVRTYHIPVHQEIIDEVPGIEREEAKISSDTKRHFGRIAMNDQGFKGDPSKVPGTEAYQLRMAQLEAEARSSVPSVNIRQY